MLRRWIDGARRAREADKARAQFEAKSKERNAGARDLDAAAREYHRTPPAGKMATHAVKPLATVSDLALAYSPGVAAPARDIAADAKAAGVLTNKARTVAVISNGTAVLGLGDIGALAAKPVMEGKAALFKRFAGLDAVDLCIDEKDPGRLAEMIIALAPSFGGVNLEDIKAPECFTVERLARAGAPIPVFHDDQHGTAACVLAGLTNALTLTDRRFEDVRLVASGAGAAAIACLDLLVAAGLRKENILLVDRQGVVSAARRKSLSAHKARYAVKTKLRTLDEAVRGADVFLGVSAGGLLTTAAVGSMAASPIIFALANPNPEIWPEDAKRAAPGAIVATGRTDYPNQVNNVLCFPFLFRGALDVGASAINEAMVRAAAKAIAALAQTPPPESVRRAYGAGGVYAFGPDYILPKPFDPRLLPTVAVAVAAAAADSGLAVRPVADLGAYAAALEQEAVALAHG